ncbi:hypothetical protein [Diplocloster modestus]|uniref:Uncharacterized protein n=1 Tax=Diplocloster modestus TaxID=2850322 RepID=A0ABS6K731_9FIRM|nr:hypothetical protein [Diplocloster modestus]MBU9726320.1 hypothetical protein [Diplocloster modestus]
MQELDRGGIPGKEELGQMQAISHNNQLFSINHIKQNFYPIHLAGKDNSTRPR